MKKISEAIMSYGGSIAKQNANIITMLKLMKDNHITNNDIMYRNSNNNEIKSRHHQIQVFDLK